MKRTQTELTYLRAAVQNASAAGLVIILFDLLVGDLERVIVAMDQRDIEKRSDELKHAFLILQQLEGSLEMENGGQAAQHFSRFYSAVRAKLLEAHLKVDAGIVRRQIQLLLEVRQAWQQVEAPSLASPASQGVPAAAQSPFVQQVRHLSSSGWTA
jgi:flagellar secretion chaperone FliS